MFEERVSDRLLNSARKVCGDRIGRKQRDRETWWWNEEIQIAVMEKKLAFKRWKEPRKNLSNTGRKISRQKEQLLLRTEPGKYRVNFFR